jgi:hypothetical protein
VESRRKKQTKIRLVAGNEGPAESDQVKLDLLAPFHPRRSPFWNDFPRIYLREKRPCVCQSCIDIDKRIDQLRQLVRSTTDPSEIERINRLIAELYRERVRSHKNPQM